MGLSSLSSQDIEKFLVLTEILSADIVEILENADKFVPYINATIDVDLGSQNLTTTGDILLEFGDLVSEQNPDTVDAIRMKATSSDVDVVLGVGGCFNIWNATDSVPTDNIFNVRDNGDVFITGAIDMNSNQINELTDPTANQDAATKKYVDDNDFWQRVGTVLSPKTAGDDIKVSGVTILDAAPILVFRDSNGAGAASTGFIEWKDSGGGRAGYFGNASSGDDDLSWGNEQGGHIKIITTGAGELQVSAPLNMNTHKVLGVADPTLDQDAATKKYVDDNGGLFSEDADDNIVGGTNAGSELSTGANNFYGGVAAGRYGDGSYNVGIGSQALEGTIANNFAQNIGIGRQAGVALTTGSNNVFLGYIAGSIVTTGVGNTLLGAAAGTNITTSGNNIVIGAGMLPLSATVWRQFALGVGGYPFLRGDMTNYQLAIYGADGYLNFNTTLGSTGYGIRDSSGVMEFKDSGGSWQVIGAGSHTIASHSDTTATGTELEALTDNSIVDALHRHSELSASDGSPDAVVRVDTDGMLIVDAIGTGLDVLHSATIGNHLDVGDNLTVDTNTLFVDSTTHRVGIGTTSPSQKLEIVGAAGVNVYPKVTSAATSKDSAFWFHDSTYSVFCGLLGTTTGVTDGDFVIYAGATRMVVRQSDGNVGIGTTAPTSKLHVVGLPAYANNAAAVTGGLTAGAFYRTNGDPDLVCVVH